MPINLIGNPGGFFPSIGKHGLAANRLKTLQTNLEADLTNAVTGLVAQYAAEIDLRASVESNYINILNGAAANLSGFLSSLAASTANRLVFRDVARQGQTLQQQNTLASVLEIVRQMAEQGGVTIRQHDSIAATATGFSRPNGIQAPQPLQNGGVLVTSIRRPSDGLILQHALAEDITVSVTDDSYLSGAAAGNEGLAFSGEGEQQDPWAFNWPLGSDCSGSLSAIDGQVSNGAGNKLRNSSFETWSGGRPSFYTINSGLGLLGQETTITFENSPSSALRITGDGATLLEMQQPFNNGSAGTVDELDPLTQYSYAVWLRRGAAAITGTLRFELVDNFLATLPDAGGTLNRMEVDLANLNTTWQAFTVMVRTPHIMPSPYSWRIYNPAGGAVSSGGLVYIDKGGLGDATQTTRSGIYLACHSGATRFATGDRAVVTTTNGRGSGGTLNTFMTLLYRLFFPLFRDEEIIPPYSTTPTVSDNLLT